MYSIVSTAIVRGIESIPIRVEADVTDGMPVFEMVGFLSAEVREARERVRTALKTWILGNVTRIPRHELPQTLDFSDFLPLFT